MTQSESLLTVEEIANYVKLHVETVRRLIREGEIPALRIEGLALGTEGHFLKNTTSNASNFGFEGHGSYFILPKRLELAVRGAGTIRQDGGVYTEGSTNTYELGSALGYYFWRQNIKLVGDYNLLLNNGVVSGQKDHQFRLQVQLCFCQGGLS